MDDLDALARHLLDEARTSAHGRSAHLFLHDGPLRQAVIALTAGTELDEHNTPPAASLHVLHGRVRLTGQGGGPELKAGQVAMLPRERHGLLALENAAVVLTAVTGVPLSERRTAAAAATPG
ncbi:cupin [Streptomyces angustmyceticus]|uniref:cupin n=1 Tax=Streptomyces angustmyceticus TaxID=285578 RepID=UPI00344D7183